MASSTKKTRAKRKPKYKAVLELPPLSNEEFAGLRNSIGVNGVLVPIVVDSDGPIRKIIDGNYRKQIADEFGYDCPEIVQDGLTEDEKRTLARCLNLARRQLTQEQKRELIADQLREATARSNRWIAKQLGVHHATVASVRKELESVGQIIHLDEVEGEDGKRYPSAKNHWQIRGVGDPLTLHPTPQHVTEALLSRETFDGMILEPASGSGAMVDVLRQHGYKVRATDINSGHNFLNRKATVANVITNPPYAQSMAEQFVRKAMEVAEHKIAMLLPFYFLEGVQRNELFTCKEFPVKSIYIFSRRPAFGESRGKSPFGCAWVVWDRAWTGKTEVEWV